MIIKRLTVIVILKCMVTIIAPAQPPEGYYDSAAGLSGKALQQALHDIIDDHTAVSYSDLWTCFQSTDKKADGTVWDMYSDIPEGIPAYIFVFITDQCGDYSAEGNCYNREHSFPKSWFNDAAPMYTDLFHIYPTDGWVNNKRGKLPYGETNNPAWTSTNGSMVGPSSIKGYTGAVFEPIDEYKGDFARTFFYMATRYYGEDSTWPGSDMTIGAQPRQWALAMLLAWHRADAVSTKETDRNNEVYKYQNNRNPFIDDPQFAEKIWGTLNPVEETVDNSVSMTLWPNPANEYVYISTTDILCPGAVAYIYDNSGCLVMTETVIDEMTTLSTEWLASGIYFVRIVCGSQVLSGTFVVASR
jgi:endonuclease I